MRKKIFTNAVRRGPGAKGHYLEVTSSQQSDYLHVIITPNDNYIHKLYFEKATGYGCSITLSSGPVTVTLPFKESGVNIPWSISAELKSGGSHPANTVTCDENPAGQDDRWDFKLPNNSGGTDTHITISMVEDNTGK